MQNFYPGVSRSSLYEGNCRPEFDCNLREALVHTGHMSGFKVRVCLRYVRLSSAR